MAFAAGGDLSLLIPSWPAVKNHTTLLQAHVFGLRPHTEAHGPRTLDPLTLTLTGTGCPHLMHPPYRVMDHRPDPCFAPCTGDREPRLPELAQGTRQR